MFKRTNKLWKGLALVLALCMISTVAYADPSTAVIQNLVGEYDAATKTVTISGEITVPGNDVTILALRSGAEYDALNEVWTEEMLPEKVIYIDQEASDETTGEFSFSFMPRAGVRGGCISVFVGGEDVADVEVWSTNRGGESAPTLVPEIDVWYEGVTELTFDLMSGDEPFENADDWGAIIETVTVFNGDDTLDVDYSYEEGKLTLANFNDRGESITKIEITTVDNAYAKAVWTGELEQEPKELGENVLTVTESVVAGGYAEITVTTEDTAWMENLADYVYIDEVPVVGAGFDDNILSVPVDLDDQTLEGTVTITVSRDYYVDETVNVTVTAPTKVVADAAEISWEYSDTIVDAGTGTAAAKEADTEATAEDLKARYGAAIVTLPTPETGYTYSWTAVSTDEGAEEITIANNAESVTLDRPDYEAEPTEESPQSYTYTLTLTVSDGVYKDAPKTFATISVSRVGMRGVPVAATPSFSGNAQQSAAIAANATATLTGATGDIALTWDAESGSFKGENVAPGEYTITIVRLGFLVGSATITVEADGNITGEMPEMIAGDTDGNGEIDVLDVNEIVNNWGSTTDVATNIDGNDIVDILDVNIVVNNWGAQGVGTDELE